MLAGVLFYALDQSGKNGLLMSEIIKPKIRLWPEDKLRMDIRCLVKNQRLRII
jgi:hypothetical protein